MAAVWYRARAEPRRDWRTVATLALIGLVGEASLTAASAPGLRAARLRPAEILGAE